MPTIKYSDIGKFARKTQMFATVGLPVGTNEAISKAALLATTAARASIAAGSGGDSRLSNVGRGGANVGARFDVKPGTGGATALVRATGPLQLLDNPTSPHQIMTKVRKGRSKASRGAFYEALFGGSGGFSGMKPLRTPYGPRYRVKHPGTSGKRTFWRAIDNTRPLIPVVFRTQLAREMRRYFG